MQTKHLPNEYSIPSINYLSFWSKTVYLWKSLHLIHEIRLCNSRLFWVKLSEAHPSLKWLILTHKVIFQKVGDHPWIKIGLSFWRWVSCDVTIDWVKEWWIYPSCDNRHVITPSHFAIMSFYTQTDVADAEPIKRRGNELCYH